MLKLNSIKKGYGGTQVSVEDMSFLSNTKKIIRTTGIQQINVLRRDELLSAFIELVDNNQHLFKDIKLFIVVNQTKPFELPQVSNFLLENIGCQENIECIDLSLGCTGYVYATTLADRLLNVHEECIILTGDAISSEINTIDTVNKPLFGDAPFLSLFTKVDNNTNYTNFNLFEGAQDLYLNNRNSEHLPTNGFYMNGISIFNFGLHRVTNIIEKFSIKYNLKNHYIILHQANRFMLKSMMTKLKEFQFKDVYNDGTLGNTGPSTIPDTILYNFEELKGQECLVVGFGVGLQISINIIRI
jgi:3-oxoacyl-[acyl-carrier-protein] synthase III